MNVHLDRLAEAQIRFRPRKKKRTIQT